MRVIAKVTINFKFKRLFMRKFKQLNHYFIASLVAIGLLSACATHINKPELTKVTAKNIVITDTIPSLNQVDKFVMPYRKHVEEEMNKVLSQNANDLVKDRKHPRLNTAISNLFGDATYEIVSPIYKKRTGNDIDFVLMNWGGIRADLAKGPVTVGDAYALMPFENEVVIVTMKGEKVQELVDYLIKHRLPHPLSKQVALQITQDGKIVQFTINGKPFDPNATYRVATSDYLFNGGDAMYFFGNPIQKEDTGYKIRNVLIDYFKQTDVIDAKEDHRFEYKP